MCRGTHSSATGRPHDGVQAASDSFPPKADADAHANHIARAPARHLTMLCVLCQSSVCRCGSSCALTAGWLQAAADLSSSQKQALMGMRTTFLGRLQSIVEQRRRIIFELHDSVPDSHSSALTDATIAKARPHGAC